MMEVVLSFTREEEGFSYRFKVDEDLETILEKFELLLTSMGFELEGQRLMLDNFKREVDSSPKMGYTRGNVTSFPGSTTEE